MGGDSLASSRTNYDPMRDCRNLRRVSWVRCVDQRQLFFPGVVPKLVFRMSGDGIARQARTDLMNRTVRVIVRSLLIIALLFLLLSLEGIGPGVDSEHFLLLICLPPLLAATVVIWFDPPERNPKWRRVYVWVIMLFVCAWGLTGLIQRTSNKAILIFVALALLVVSEWRYARLDAAHRTWITNM